MVVDAIPTPRRQERLRRLMDSLMNKRNEQLLDDTGYNRRRRVGDEYGVPERPNGGGINVPSSAIVGLLLYLLAQTAGGIWWAATMTSNANHAEADRAREEQRLNDSLNNYHLEVNALRLDIARVQGAQFALQGQNQQPK